MSWLTVVVVRTSRSAYPSPDGLAGSPLGRERPAPPGHPPMIHSCSYLDTPRRTWGHYKRPSGALAISLASSSIDFELWSREVAKGTKTTEP